MNPSSYISSIKHKTVNNPIWSKKASTTAFRSNLDIHSFPIQPWYSQLSDPPLIFTAFRSTLDIHLITNKSHKWARNVKLSPAYVHWTALNCSWFLLHSQWHSSTELVKYNPKAILEKVGGLWPSTYSQYFHTELSFFIILILVLLLHFPLLCLKSKMWMIIKCYKQYEKLFQ